MGIVGHHEGREDAEEEKTVKSTSLCSDAFQSSPRYDEQSLLEPPTTMHTSTLPDDTCVFRWFEIMLQSFAGIGGRRPQCAAIEERAGGTFARGRSEEQSAVENGTRAL